MKRNLNIRLISTGRQDSSPLRKEPVDSMYLKKPKGTEMARQLVSPLVTAFLLKLFLFKVLGKIVDTAFHFSSQL